MIKLNPNVKARAINKQGVNVILTEADGAIDWLPEEVELSLVKRKVAVFASGATDQPKTPAQNQDDPPKTPAQEAEKPPEDAPPAPGLDDLDKAALVEIADKLGLPTASKGPAQLRKDIEKARVQLLERAAGLGLDVEDIQGDVLMLKGAVTAAEAEAAAA